jgi:hypothetical protein
MAILASDKGGTDFKPVPEGTHVAICNMVVDMGVQGGGQFKPSRKVYIRWELPNEKTEWTDKNGDKHSGPMVVGNQYTLSLSEKANLRADLESWRGKTFTEQELEGFDVTKVLGKACLLGIVHNIKGNKTYANIKAVMGLTKGTVVPPAHNALVQYTPDDHDQATFDLLPPWLQEMIQNRKKIETVSASRMPSDDDFRDSPLDDAF